MRSNKRASIGIGTLVTMIIAIIFIAVVVLFLIYPAQFGNFFKSFLPSSNGDNPSYGSDLINGTDEEIPISEGGNLIYVGNMGDWRDGRTPVYHEKDNNKDTLILVYCGINGGKWEGGSVSSLITIERYYDGWLAFTNKEAQDKKKIVLKMNGVIIGGVSSYGQIYLVYNELPVVQSFFKNIGWTDFSNPKTINCINSGDGSLPFATESVQLVLKQISPPAFFIDDKNPAVIKTNLVIKDYKTFAASLGVTL